MMNSMFQLEIPRRSVLCSHLGERLLPGMEIYSQLFEEEGSGQLARRDFCPACWSHLRDAQAAPPLARGGWKSKIEERKIAAASSRVGRALALLRSLIHSLEAPEANEAEIFVLCLYLARARQIILRQEFHRDGSNYNLYEILHTEQFLTVKAINLSQIQIEAVQKSLADQLNAVNTHEG